MWPQKSGAFNNKISSTTNEGRLAIVVHWSPKCRLLLKYKVMIVPKTDTLKRQALTIAYNAHKSTHTGERHPSLR